MLNSGSASFADANAGNGKAVTFSGFGISGADAGNYSFSQPAASTATITQAPLTITASDKTKTYGNANPLLNATYTGLLGGDTSAVVTGLTFTAPGAGANVGSYGIVPSGASAANYAIAYLNGTLTVNPVILTVTADSKTRDRGMANSPLTFTYAGLENGDTNSVFTGALTTSAAMDSLVGSYAIRQGSFAAGANYLIDYVAETLTVVDPMPPITATLGQTNNYINPSLIVDHNVQPVSIIYLGNPSSFGNTSPAAGLLSGVKARSRNHSRCPMR